jgi:hypothetical protein
MHVFFLQLMYNKLKQILYIVILILAPLTNNSSSAPDQGIVSHADEEKIQ